MLARKEIQLQIGLWTGGVLNSNTLSKDKLAFDPKHLKDNGKTLIEPRNKNSKGQILFISAIKAVTGDNMKEGGKGVKYPF